MTTAITGRDLVIKVGDGASPEVFTQIAALRDTTISHSETSVDATTKDDAGVRQLLSGKILNAVSVSGTGVFTDSATLNTVRTSMSAGTHKNYKILIADSSATTAGGTYTGAFRVTAFGSAGSHSGEINYNLTLESAGTVSFAN